MLKLKLLNYRLSICKIEGRKLNNIALDSPFLSITQSEDELSCVCAEGFEPKNAICEKGFAAFVVSGVLDFSLTGILSSLLQPLADAKISVFAVSTYNTDYILIREQDIAKAIDVLSDVCIIEQGI